MFACSASCSYSAGASFWPANKLSCSLKDEFDTDSDGSDNALGRSSLLSWSKETMLFIPRLKVKGNGSLFIPYERPSLMSKSRS
jgi:hypothetical protein